MVFFSALKYKWKAKSVNEAADHKDGKKILPLFYFIYNLKMTTTLNKKCPYRIFVSKKSTVYVYLFLGWQITWDTLKSWDTEPSKYKWTCKWKV